MTSGQSKRITGITYDPFTQMPQQVSEGADTTVSFLYDGKKERLVKAETIHGNTTQTLYLRGMSANVLTEITTGLSTSRYYVYGPTGLLSIVEDTTKYFVLKDHLGSTRVVLRGVDNTPISWYDYDPFGTMWRATESYQAKYKFTGQEYDVATALHNFHARFYDSDLGQFYAADPAGQGFSPYAYCGNNPLFSFSFQRVLKLIIMEN